MDGLFSGVIDDPREDARIQRGFQAEEVIAGDDLVTWKPKATESLKKFPIWSQAQSSACVAFAKAKQITIEVYRLTGVWIDISPASIYQLRFNRPGLGMNIADANEIVNKKGATLEALMKSQNLSEREINSVKRTRVADLFAKAIAEAVMSYLYLPITMDGIARVLEQSHAVSLLIFAKSEEYGDTPQILDSNLTYAIAPIRHEVVAVDYYLHPIYGKCLWIEDSWGVGTGQGGRRNFTEEFLTKRCILADYLDVFEFDPEEEKPTVVITKDLRLGTKDSEVTKLQDYLKATGDFPANQPSSGLYGAITARAVLQWQLRNKIDTREMLMQLEGSVFGPKSRMFAQS